MVIFCWNKHCCNPKDIELYISYDKIKYELISIFYLPLNPSYFIIPLSNDNNELIKSFKINFLSSHGGPQVYANQIMLFKEKYDRVEKYINFIKNNEYYVFIILINRIQQLLHLIKMIQYQYHHHIHIIQIYLHIHHLNFIIHHLIH